MNRDVMNLATQIKTLREQAYTDQHRRLMVLSGSEHWCWQQAQQLDLDEQTVWLGAEAPEIVERMDGKQAQRLLGRTVSQLIINAWDGLNPDALGQASGTLCGGGLLVLLCPPLEQWPDYDDPEHKAMAPLPWNTDDVGRRFIRRLAALIVQDSRVLLVREKDECSSTLPVEVLAGQNSKEAVFQMPSVAAIAEQSDIAHEPEDNTCVIPTLDQQRTIQAVLNTARNRRQPLVITADRGRGKSAALGMAAAELLKQGRQIWVTAPGYQACREIFQFARAQLPDVVIERGSLRWQQGALQYLEPAALLAVEAQGAIVLVDEAAAIPAPMLTALLERFNRIVFSTTIHGYEGTGRGFAVRFRQQLEQRAPRWRSISLSQPVRWADNDPLEALIFKALLLDAEAAPDVRAAPDAAVEISPVQVIERLDRDQLVADESLLRQLFGLLVQAHYRTTPSDMRLLLDSPGLSVWCLREQKSGQRSSEQLLSEQLSPEQLPSEQLPSEQLSPVLACALVADEGPLAPELAHAVWAGQRRPPGHLFPQTLIAQAGFPDVAALRCARIMRIAVHPMRRRQQLGAQLLHAIKQDASQRQLDYLGASFATSADLVPFWLKAGYLPVRIGLTRDAVSGAHAVLMMKPVSSEGKQVFSQLRQRYSEQLPWLLQSELAELETALLPGLLQEINVPHSLNAQDLLDLEGFALHSRTLDSSRYALRQLALQLFAHGPLPEQSEYRQLLAQHLSMPAMGRPREVHRKQQRRLREMVAYCLKQLSETTV
ncbi:MAG: GNAT family N-acetyltransferase [Marinobacterium sp.]|nr:GNAT family N-acetyltransferase [Marinobacterium sp.]